MLIVSLSKIVPTINMTKSVVDTIRAFQVKNTFRNATEIRNPILLSAQGTIPDWLNGVLYRIGKYIQIMIYDDIPWLMDDDTIGPAKYNLSDNGKQHTINHAFDGLTFVHRFEISAKQQVVKYNSRLTAEGAEKAIVKSPASDTYFGHLAEVGGPLSKISQVVQRVTPFGNKDEKDPSSDNVGVTITPEYPLPNKFDNKDDTDPLVVVSKTDANLLQSVHSVTLGKTVLSSSIIMILTQHIIHMQSPNAYLLMLLMTNVLME